MKKFGEKWPTDVMMTSSIGQKQRCEFFFPQHFHLNISKIILQKTACQQLVRFKRRRKAHSKVGKMSSYSINIYKQWTLRNWGFAAHRCAAGHYATSRSRESSLFYLIQYKCSTSLEAKFHGASKSAIGFFTWSTRWRTSRDL